MGATVQKIEELVSALTAFDNSLKTLDSWKDAATNELKDIKEASGNMLPEDRVARTMDLQEDIAAKLEILKANAQTEQELLPQGDKVPADAQAFKDELTRITKYVKVLDAANAASQKMTTHTEADAEVAGLRERYAKVKSVSDTWVKKLEVLVKEWTLLDNTVTELNSWVAKDKSAEGENQ